VTLLFMNSSVWCVFAGSRLHDGRRVATSVGQSHGLPDHEDSHEVSLEPSGLRPGRQESHGPEESLPGGGVHLHQRLSAHESHRPRCKKME